MLPLLLLFAHTTIATPFLDNIRALDLPDLFGRSSCPNPCGWAGQLCCSSSQYCYTDSNNQAQCGDKATTAAAGGGYWTVWTSTYVQTDLLTMTSVGSSYITPTASPNAECNYSLDETPLGPSAAPVANTV